jgi:WD40 repeat protein
LIRIGGQARFFGSGVPKALAVGEGARQIALSTWGGEVILYDGPAARNAHILQDEVAAPRLAFSPDGNRLLGVSAYGKLHVWDTRTQQPVPDAAIQLSKEPIRHAEFSADANRIVFSDGRERVRVVDTSSGKTLSDVRLPGGIISLRISPDGRRLAFGCPEGRAGRVYVRRVADGEKPVDFRVPDSPRLLCFSPDGQRLAVYCPGGQGMQPLTGTFLYDSTTGKRIRTLAAARRTEGLEFSPDGRTVLVSYPSDGGALLVPQPSPTDRRPGTSQPAAREPTRIDWDGEYPKLVAFSPEGRWIAAATRGNEVVLYDAATGAREPPSPTGHAAGITLLTPAGPGRLVSGDSTGRLCLWGLPQGRLLAQAQLPARPWGADVSADGRRLAIITLAGPYRCDLPDDDPQPRDARTQPSSRPAPHAWPVRRLGSETSAKPDLGTKSWLSSQVAWLDANRILCTGFRAQRTYDAASGERIADVRIAWPRTTGPALSPDGRFFAEWQNDGASLVALSASGELLTVLTGDAKVDGTLLTRGARRAILIQTNTGQLQVVETFTGKTLWRNRQVSPRSHSWVSTLRDDDQLLALRGPFEEHKDNKGPYKLRFFDMIDGRQVGELVPNMRYVADACFTHDGSGIAVGLTDGTVAVYAAPEAPSLGAKREDLPKLWEQLASEKPGSALRAVFAMAELGAPAAAFLAERLQPARLGPSADVVRLIGQLNADTYAERQAASEALRKLGVQAEPAMRQAIEGSPTAEQRNRLEVILAELSQRRWRLMTASRAARAVEVLSRLDHPSARQVLSKLAAGAKGHWLTETARQALRH